MTIRAISSDLKTMPSSPLQITTHCIRGNRVSERSPQCSSPFKSQSNAASGQDVLRSNLAKQMRTLGLTSGSLCFPKRADALLPQDRSQFLEMQYDCRALLSVARAEKRLHQSSRFFARHTALQVSAFLHRLRCIDRQDFLLRTVVPEVQRQSAIERISQSSASLYCSLNQVRAV